MPLGEGLGHSAPDLGSFVDRGDPLNPDFWLGDLTTNAAWHDLDLSGIVAAGAGAVLLRVAVDSPGAEDQISFRRNGNVLGANIALVFTQVAGVSNNVCLIVPCDRGRVVEYRADNVVWNGIDITVMGWWRG